MYYRPILNEGERHKGVYRYISNAKRDYPNHIIEIIRAECFDGSPMFLDERRDDYPPYTVRIQRSKYGQVVTSWNVYKEDIPHIKEVYAQPQHSEKFVTIVKERRKRFG